MKPKNYSWEDLQRMMAELIISQKEIKDMFKETDIRFKQTDAQFKETDRFLKKIGKELGNIGNNNGDVAEDFFFYGFSSTMQIAGIKYNYIERNKERLIKKLQDEYDIVLFNSKRILVVEVKYKLHPNDIISFYEQKLPNFKKIFPEYKDYTINGAVAGLSVPNESYQKAIDYGLMVFTQSGKNIKNLTPKDMQLTEF